MFGKKKTSATFVGPGDIIEGTLRITGTLHIDGEVRGDIIAAGSVSVGPDGLISGEVHAHTLTVGGRVAGTVHVREHLHLLASGVVEGDAHFKSLQVDRGGVIHGTTGAFEEARPTEPEAAEPAGDNAGGDDSSEVAAA